VSLRRKKRDRLEGKEFKRRDKKTAKGEAIIKEKVSPVRATKGLVEGYKITGAG